MRFNPNISLCVWFSNHSALGAEWEEWESLMKWGYIHNLIYTLSFACTALQPCICPPPCMWTVPVGPLLHEVPQVPQAWEGSHSRAHGHHCPPSRCEECVNPTVKVVHQLKWTETNLLGFRFSSASKYGRHTLKAACMRPEYYIHYYMLAMLIINAIIIITAR